MSARRLRLTTWLAAASLALGASTTAAACSSGNKGNPGDGGPHDAAIDQEDDTPVDSGGGGNADVVVYPDAPSLQSPDGCYILGGPCQSDTMCCTGFCDDGGCAHMPIQM